MKLAVAALAAMICPCCVAAGGGRFVTPEDVYKNTVAGADGSVIGPIAGAWSYTEESDCSYRIFATADSATIQYTFPGQEEILPLATDENGRAFPVKATTAPGGYIVDVVVPLDYLRSMAADGIEFSVRTRERRDRDGRIVRVQRREPPVRPVYIQGFLRRMDEGR